MCADSNNRLKSALKNLDRPGERKAGFGLKLRNDPMNLLGIMPAKEGGNNKFEALFCRVLFVLG